MATTNNNKKILHRKEWEFMTPSPVASSAWSFIIKDHIGNRRTTLFVSSATVSYLYWVDEDAWELTPSLALAGTFGAGACGEWGLWSNTLTANGGTTTTLTTATSINNGMTWLTVRFLTWSQAGKEATVTSVDIIPWGTNTITFTPALSSAIVNTDTFAFNSWRYYVLNAGTVAANIFKSIDPITWVVTALGTTWLPATIGTECRLKSTPSYMGKYVADTTATIFSATTIGAVKTWTVNSFANYQVRIVSGTGIGQIRTITSNTATTLTVPTWTTTPDVTSVFCIESNDDFIYLLGNNAVTMYRYSISGATWTTLSPWVARAGAPVAGCSANWIGKSGSTTWADENNIKDWRYIYSFRWGATSTLDRYDIALNAWATITYVGAAETFTTGSGYDMQDGAIYIRKDATNRYFRYDAIGNNLYPFSTNIYPDGAAVAWDKMFSAQYQDWATKINWLYALRNTWTELHRIMIY